MSTPTRARLVLPDGVERCKASEALMIYCPDCGECFNALNVPWSLSSVMWMHTRGRPDHRPVYVRLGRPRHGVA